MLIGTPDPEVPLEAPALPWSFTMACEVDWDGEEESASYSYPIYDGNSRQVAVANSRNDAFLICQTVNAWKAPVDPVVDVFAKMKADLS